MMMMMMMMMVLPLASQFDRIKGLIGNGYVSRPCSHYYLQSLFLKTCCLYGYLFIHYPGTDSRWVFDTRSIAAMPRTSERLPFPANAHHLDRSFGTVDLVRPRDG